MNIALAMTIAPRREVTIDRSLVSLREAGFHEDVHVLAEPGTVGSIGAAAKTLFGDERVHVRENKRLRGCFGNWKKALKRLLSRTNARWLLILQDDVVWKRGSAEILRAQIRSREGHRTGLLSPYTSSVVVGEHFVDGWNECCLGWGFWGALAFCMDRDAAKELLRHPRFAEHGGAREVDAVVAASMLDLGRPSFVHVPSLVDHIGVTSTIDRDGEWGRRGYRFNE